MPNYHIFRTYSTFSKPYLFIIFMNYLWQFYACTIMYYCLPYTVRHTESAFKMHADLTMQTDEKKAHETVPPFCLQFTVCSIYSIKRKYFLQTSNIKRKTFEEKD